MPKKKKKRGKGKAKGSAFEREVIRDIVQAFSSFGVTLQDVNRSRISGGHPDAFGDITFSSAVAKLFNFAVECKSYKKVNLYDFLMPWNEINSKSKDRIGGWWKQAVQGALKCNRAPLLVFKANSQAVMCAVPCHVLNATNVKNHLHRKPRILAYLPMTDDNKLIKICVIRWDWFLKAYVKVQKGIYGYRGKR